MTGIHDWVTQRRHMLEESGVCLTDWPGNKAAFEQLLIASDYVFEALLSTPSWLPQLLDEPALGLADDASQLPADALLRFRQAQACRLIARDVAGVDDIEATMRHTSQLAWHIIQAAHQQAHREVAERHGHLLDAEGQPMQLIVFALGKLGGRELNFASDVDLVFAHRGDGQSDGRRSLDANAYFTRVGRRLIDWVETSRWPVDMRLRPYGDSGPLTLSLAAMEQYFARDGRDWERYAWIKAVPVCDDQQAGADFLHDIQPFIYRRYLDYQALDGLRSMKGSLDAEVIRSDRSDNIKLGPGGIRELEYLVQTRQLIRGGRDPNLRHPSLLHTLDALHDAGYIHTNEHDTLGAHYRFLRHVENRLQMLRLGQTHELPDDALDQQRLAVGMGFADAPALLARLHESRTVIHRLFVDFFRPQNPHQAKPSTTDWLAFSADTQATQLTALGYPDDTAKAISARLQQLAKQAQQSMLRASAKDRLTPLIDRLLTQLKSVDAPEHTLARVLTLLTAIWTRSSYLALLDEQPQTFERLIWVARKSAFLTEQVAKHPVLLDDLLDARINPDAPFFSRLSSLWAADDETVDAEQVLIVINEMRQSQSFRHGLRFALDDHDAKHTAKALTHTADAVIDAVLQLVRQEIRQQYGCLGDDFGLAVVAYGSLGGRELGFGSDLDLVFLFDDDLKHAVSDGAKQLDANQYFVRATQKFLRYLSAPTVAGQLYECDTRLRPDGRQGMLVSSVAAFGGYQNERAWTWEKQALVRARLTSGNDKVGHQFAQIRQDTLANAAHTNLEQLRADVATMRQKLRQETDRSHTDVFDLKQGLGGLVDIECISQFGVLSSPTAPEQGWPTETAKLLRLLTSMDTLSAQEGADLLAAHDHLLTLGLGCTLDNRKRMLPMHLIDDGVREVVQAVMRRLKLLA